MKIYLDTSSLIKLYHYEDGSKELDELFEENTITKVTLSELAKVEYDSAIWKKYRTKELNQEEVDILISSFVSDFIRFCFIKLNSDITNHARSLISVYGNEGLRTLDAIQLASAVKEKGDLDFFVTSDNLLKALAIKEGLSVY